MEIDLLDLTVSTTFVVIALLAILVQSFMLFLALFQPGLRYRITCPASGPLDSEEFLYTLEAVTDAKANCHTECEVLTNGDVFYEAELAAMAAARESITLEAYIFYRGEIAQRFLKVLAERARAGVRVHLLMDGLGSASTPDNYFDELKAAGGRFAWYHPIRWYTLTRYNNRTHRELLVVDGRVGFLGGSGIADQWWLARPGHPRWRDTMVRVTGDAVPSLQATFLENWLEACGEVLTGPVYFPLLRPGREAKGSAAALVVNSTPSAGGSTRARILMQTLIASAQRSVDITTPYFLPDRSLSDELVRAARDRGVDVRLVTPGSHTDHLLTRSSSRRAYGKLLLAGIRIYEYIPAMIHAKILIVDEMWSVVGSSNFDNRSFGLNDEVNLAVHDRGLAARLAEDFARDLSDSREITYEQWRKRSWVERVPELVGWVLERQQ
jgi:cardiolipin synthase